MYIYIADHTVVATRDPQLDAGEDPYPEKGGGPTNLFEMIFCVYTVIIM